MNVSPWGRFPTIHLVMAVWIIAGLLFVRGIWDERIEARAGNGPCLTASLGAGVVGGLMAIMHWWRNRAESGAAFDRGRR